MKIYHQHCKKQWFILLILAIILLAVFLLSLSVGAVSIPLSEVVQTLLGKSSSTRWSTIIWEIRLPQALTAIMAGLALSISGVVMQSILRNPLASPFTLGISHSAAFGAAIAVMFLGTSSIIPKSFLPYTTAITAFICTLITTFIIMAIAKVKKGSPEVIILTGVALGSLFTAGTALLQYFADDTQLSSIVFWSFGDLARASWSELGLLSVIALLSTIYFIMNRWNYNAMSSGDETAKGLGVAVNRVRISSMIVASVLTASTISILGVIGFVGLISPHIGRRIIGNDHRSLLLFGALLGGVLLLLADTIGRTIISPHTIPVSVITSFMGAPLFIYILLRSKK